MSSLRNIRVENSIGKSFPMTIDIENNVSSLLDGIRREKNILATQRLQAIHLGKRMDEDAKISTFNIENGSTIYFIYLVDTIPKVSVTVHFIEKGIITFPMLPSHSFWDLKETMKVSLGQSLDLHQFVLLGDDIIEDTVTIGMLEEYGIYKNFVVLQTYMEGIWEVYPQ